MTDVVELADRALNELSQTVAQVGPRQWDRPTPCELWTVRDLLAHIVAVNRKYERIPAGGSWLPGLEPVDLGDDPAGTYRETVPAFLAAWRRPAVLSREVLTQGGRSVGAEVVLRAHLRETLVHGWDLAVSIDRPAPFDNAVVRTGLESVLNTPAIRPDGVGYADAVPIADDAPPLDRMAALCGRDVATWR